MNKSKVIDKLNDILRWEWTGVVQYTQHAFMVQDLWREVYAAKFREGAEESMKHARAIGDKIVALGGVPTVERDEVRQSTVLEEMLHIGLDFERGAVKLYAEALELCGDNTPLRVLLEDIILQEQEGVEEFEKLLGGHERAASKDKRKGKAI